MAVENFLFVVVNNKHKFIVKESMFETFKKECDEADKIKVEKCDFTPDGYAELSNL